MSEYEAIMKEREESREKRRAFITSVKTGDFIIVEIGNLSGDTYVVGTRKEDAAKWLESHTSVLMDGKMELTFELLKECAEKFNVIIDTLY